MNKPLDYGTNIEVIFVNQYYYLKYLYGIK